VSARAVKRCPRCGRLKSAGEFYRRQRTLRLSPYCRPCTRAAAHESHQRRRQDPAAVERLRVVDRARQRRHRALGGEDPSGGVGA
jgi:hypothetical protein